MYWAFSTDPRSRGGVGLGQYKLLLSVVNHKAQRGNEAIAQFGFRLACYENLDREIILEMKHRNNICEEGQHQVVSFSSRWSNGDERT